MPDRHTDEELARIMRAGLATRAQQAPDRLTRAPGRRRPTPRLWPLAAAASVVLLLAVPLAVRWAGTGEAPNGDDPAAVDPSPVPSDWRVESYGGIQVRVPPEWGWGGAPMRAPWSDGEVLDCGAAPFVVEGDPDYETVPPGTPYVGRPLTMTDACSVFGQEGAPPRTPVESVWIGAAVEPGTEDLGDGWLRETVRVAEPTTFGSGTVTVTSDDPALRKAILSTAEGVAFDAHGCRADGRWEDLPSGALPDVEPVSLSVCLYGTYQGTTTLVWSTQRNTEAARAYAAEVQESSATYDPVRVCTEPVEEGQWLAIGVHGPAGRTAWTAVAMGDCAQVLWSPTGGADTVASPLSRDSVLPWAGPAVRAYVVGPRAWGEQYPDGEGLFRGYLG